MNQLSSRARSILNRHHIRRFPNPSGLSLTLHPSIFIHPNNGVYQNIRNTDFIYYEYPKHRDPTSINFMEYNRKWVTRYCDANFRKSITLISYNSSDSSAPYTFESGRIVNRLHVIGDKNYLCVRLCSPSPSST